MRLNVLASCMLAVILLVAPSSIFAETYVVDAAGTTATNWTVQGTIEFDGADYLGWNLVSDSPSHGGQFIYTPMNSSLTSSGPFGSSPNLGAQNIALDAPSASPDGGFLWLLFEDPLTSLSPGETTTIVPGFINAGSVDARMDLSTNTWWFAPMGGVITEYDSTPTRLTTWGQLKMLF